MRHMPVCCLSLLFALSACQGLPDIAARRALPTSKAPKVATLATEKPESSETSSSTASSDPSPLPSVATIALHGQVSIDAGYVLSLGRGQIIGNNGSSVLKLTGDTMLDPTDIGIISHNGGSIISHNGGSIISHNGGSYRLLDEVPVGTVLPVQGMGVIPISLSTGQALGLAVATDANGNYSLKIPADQQGNVLVVAEVPGNSNDDPILDNPRLLYSAATAATVANTVVDEDIALVTQYMRRIYSESLLQFLQSPSDSSLNFGVPASDTAVQGIIKGLAAQLRQEAASVPSASMPALADRLADEAVAEIDLSQAKIDTTGTHWNGPSELAIPAFVSIVRTVREAATARMSANPYYFDTAQYVLKVNSTRSAEEAYRILRPSDLGEFVIDNCMETVKGPGEVPFVDVLKDIGVDSLESDHWTAAISGLNETFAITLVKPSVKAAFQSTIRSFVPSYASSTAIEATD